jgi:catechol 2,3-dioxygenase-like lactoylglutathione lyase family enzyme
VNERVPTLRFVRFRLTAGALALTLLVALGLLTPSSYAQSTTTDAAVIGVESVGMTVSNMDRAVDFYTSVLGFQKLSDVEVAGEAYEQLEGVFGLRMRIVRLQLGDEVLELTQYLAPRGRPIPVDSHSNDRWFQHVAIIVRDMDEAYGWLRAHDVEHASTGPQTIPDWNVGAAGIRAFYFHDPDEHTLEVLSFPPDKGLPKWQQNDRLFLGIDHTAIVVGDTEASLQFYRDRLGFQVAGAGENYGTEQEHLNNVQGAHLRITSLRAVSGPAIELLEYLAPVDGRPIPSDAQSNDLAHWQTRLLSPAADDAIGLLRADGVRFVSPGLISVPPDTLGFNRGALLRDPDGHAMEIVAR